MLNPLYYGLGWPWMPPAVPAASADPTASDWMLSARRNAMLDPSGIRNHQPLQPPPPPPPPYCYSTPTIAPDGCAVVQPVLSADSTMHDRRRMPILAASLEAALFAEDEAMLRNRSGDEKRTGPTISVAQMLDKAVERDIMDSVLRRNADHQTDGGGDAQQQQHHLLADVWQLWSYRQEKTRDWNESQYDVSAITTLSQFWEVMSSVRLPSALPPGCDYSLFRNDVTPTWEDEANINGGRWVLRLAHVPQPSAASFFNGNQLSPAAERSVKLHARDGSANNRFAASTLDDMWLELAIYMVSAPISRFVNGVVVSVRSHQDKISVWISDCRRPDDVVRIGHAIRKRLALKPAVPLAFEAHVDAMHRRGALPIKPRFTV